MRSTKPLRVCLLQAWDPPSTVPAEPLEWYQLLPPARFALQIFLSPELLLHHVQQQSDQIDCLVIVSSADEIESLDHLGKHLCYGGVLLPTVLIVIVDESSSHEHRRRVEALEDHKQFFYHNACVIYRVARHDLLSLLHPSSESIESAPVSTAASSRSDQQERSDTPPSRTLVADRSPDERHKLLSIQVDRAVALFLQLSPTCGLPEREGDRDWPSIPERVHDQQKRLAEKLRERLGYMGVYYHRDPSRFYRRLPPAEQQALMQRLRGLYQSIVLGYFHTPQPINSRIDEFVALAFFADIGASQILELHMALMDDYAKQLKLEGRSDEILLDYRITLIDVIAHLSEMYRRSIPKDG